MDNIKTTDRWPYQPYCECGNLVKIIKLKPDWAEFEDKCHTCLHGYEDPADEYDGDGYYC